MLIEPDAMRVHDQIQWRPFAGASRPAWLCGRVRALREAEDDAQAVLAFLSTGLATHSIDPAEVVWIIDLAPAEGERAWRVLRALAGRAPRGPPIRYLAHCADVEHHARLSAHALLKPFVAGGDLFLDREGQGIPSQTIRNPIVVLAHEGVSSQSQGLYAARSGQLLEAWSDGEGGMDWRPIAQRDGVMRLLSVYRESLDGATFTLPRGAMEALSGLLRASGGRMLLRASDHGAMESAQICRGALGVRNGGEPGCDAPQTLRVNFEALARWHRANGAHVHQSQRDDDGRVLHIALHDVAGGRLRECLPEVLGLPHPDDHVQLLQALQAFPAVSPPQCLAMLHAHGGDPRALMALSRHVLQVAAGIDGVAHGQWRDMLAYCHAQHYPVFDADSERDEWPALFAGIAGALAASSQRQDYRCCSGIDVPAPPI